MIRLSDLFKNPRDWIKDIDKIALYNEPFHGIDERYHYLYAWTNIDNEAHTYQWCYLGEHNSDNPSNEEGYLGSCGNEHYWNSREYHEYMCIILGYYKDEDEVLLEESKLISDYMISTYSENGLFNLKVGGFSFSDEARLAGHTQETIGKFIQSNKDNHGGRLAWNTYEASVTQNQQKLINSIKRRVKLITDNQLQVNPYNYYYVKLLDHHDREIQRHLESICDRLYDDPPITTHPDWESDWTPLFSWFDNQDNWKLIGSDKFTTSLKFT